MHIDFLLEEQSAEVFVETFVRKVLPAGATFRVIVFQGKGDLLFNLTNRLRAYRRWIPADHRIVVLVDRDDDDCVELKNRLEHAATDAGFGTKSSPLRGSFHVINRIACEELEAWFFGDVEAIVGAYPRVPETLAEKASYRDPDAVAGGTWEALERVLQSAGYYAGGLPKIEVAREISSRMEAGRNRSESFRHFVDALIAL